ncbi:DUF4167 domain-containing protein [Paracoccus sp. WLY502]|uniref:DUF4167 domain-containing protein n=1 Tax=Paracoccus yibinensis TaxID=3068891 RepID=UPI002796D37F|nr:DUF4167 domain-containing protein [Paracoccus sp. WLY502]MDQ1901707.1 DUF4167 domain-containing protein [Paracoccus sp. WLY502]
MRSSKSRSRNKSNRQRSLGNIVNRVFDSSGPEGKVRGTPQQIIEKYLTLARDAQLSGDRVAEQAFLQHAEHYTRMLGEAQKEMAERQQFHQPRQDGDEGRDIQPNGIGSHQGGREEGGRDNGNPRDHGRRENGGRDNGHRDQQRDPREQGGREPAGRDHAPRDQNIQDQGHREQPRAEIQPESREDDQPSLRQPDPVEAAEPRPEGLPDVVTTSEDEAAGPVETPEAAAKPARSRGPRAPRGDKPAAPRTPRGRRKSPEGEPATQESPASEE